jgi:hypothetical protein
VPFQFRTLRARILTFVLGLLIVVQGAASQKHSRRLQCNPVHTAKHRELSVSDR